MSSVASAWAKWGRAVQPHPPGPPRVAGPALLALGEQGGFLCDRRIVLWRDYLDWTTFLASGVKGAGRAAVTAVGRALGR